MSNLAIFLLHVTPRRYTATSPYLRKVEHVANEPYLSVDVSDRLVNDSWVSISVQKDIDMVVFVTCYL